MPRWSRILPVLVAAFDVASAAETERMPLRLLAGRPVVEVRINERGPFDLVLDTGAGGTVLNGNLVDELGLEPTGRARVGDPAGGAGIEVERFTLDRLSVGGVELQDVAVVGWRDEAMAAALGGARGVLAPAALGDRLVTYDFPAGELILAAGALSEGDGSLPYFDPQLPIPSVEVRVAGEVLEGHIDTGNGGGISLPARLKDRLKFVGELTSAKARTASGEFEVQVGTLDGQVEVAGLAIRGPEVKLNDRFPWANVGRGALASLVLTLDPTHRRLRLTPAEGAPARTEAEGG